MVQHDIGSNGCFPMKPISTCSNGVSFTKGCYVGQEVVSRMQHRGTARNRILPVTCASALPPRARHYAGETANRRPCCHQLERKALPNPP